MFFSFRKLVLTKAFAFVIVLSQAQNPLLIPPAITGTSFFLNVLHDSTEFFTGHKTPTFGVNGNILGPTIFINQGDNVTLHVQNGLNTTTTMHWHGLNVPAKSDGGPHQVINPGSTWSPTFPMLNSAGTFWYHPHGEHKTDLQISKGLAGLLIVKDSIESSLNLPRTYGVDDIPLIIQTKCFDVLYQVAISTPFDTVPMVNATINPVYDIPAQVVRLRLLNASSERSYMLGFSNNMSFYFIASDGGLLQAPVPMNRLLLSPAERAEILVNVSSLQGQSLSLMSYGSEIPAGIHGADTVGMGMATIPGYDQNPLNGSDFNLLLLNVIAPTSNPVTTIPGFLTTQYPWNPSLSNRDRTILFAPLHPGPQDMVMGPFTLNGNQFDMHVTNDTTYLGHIEIWKLVNQTMVAHPFHLHDSQFYITDYNSGPVPDHLRGKKDVVLVMPMDSVSFITRFENYADTVPYMYHCHLLHHEDDGMMSSFIVLDSNAISISDVSLTDRIDLFPNPVNNELKIRFRENADLSEIKFSIVDLAGKSVPFQLFYESNNQARINTRSLGNGIFLLNIETKKGVVTKKFTIQHPH